ncbi:MAG: UDP-glucose 6-dehydrogenase, partial [Conexivisphaerales archaeon]|nr:UDP-glucose 6-dehydrogenase [Conexivisphaerales archaeon]
MSFLGMGYVGLTTAACFASRGIHVVGYDVDSAKIEALRKGSLPFYEPGLKELLEASRGNLTFTDDPSLLRGSDFAFITVGTPS